MNKKVITGQKPTPEVESYKKVARDLLKLSEFSLALGVCNQGLNKNPDSSAMFITKSEVFIAQYKGESNPDLLKKALSNLNNAIRLDPNNYIAKILASQIYLKGGAFGKATTLLESILAAFPNDARALSLMDAVTAKMAKQIKPTATVQNVERKALAQARDQALAQQAKEKQQAASSAANIAAGGAIAGAVGASKTGEPEISEDDVIIAGDAESAVAAPGGLDETNPGDSSWFADDQLVIGLSDDKDDTKHLEILKSNFTMFSRLDGLSAIFLVSESGEPLKIINKSRIDENVLPPLIAELYKASFVGVRKTNFGSFQRGQLVTPIGTIFLANAFYAILALVVKNDANFKTIDARINRYLEEVSR